jgi:hypothetical protein
MYATTQPNPTWGLKDIVLFGDTNKGRCALSGDADVVIIKDETFGRFERYFKR